MNMAWERWTKLGNCAEDYWITDVEYDACVIFYNETGGGEAPRVSLTVLESEMGERRFVEAFLMRKYCRLKGPDIQGLTLGDKFVNVHKCVFCCVAAPLVSGHLMARMVTGCWWHWELPGAWRPTVHSLCQSETRGGNIRPGLQKHEMREIMKETL